MKTPPEITIQPLPPGPVFADAGGYTLYVSERDTEPNRSACTDACAKDWTPVRASADAKPFDEWTLVARGDGAAQWAYRGRPLYRYTKETKPRWADGQNQTWRYALVSPFPARNAFGRQGLGGQAAAAAAANPQVAAALAQNSSTAFMRGGRAPKIALPPGTPGGISGQSTSLGNVFADGKGNTLYVSTATAACMGSCLEGWQPLSAPLLATASTGDWTIVSRPDGTLQWAYKTKPVYRSNKDYKAGDTGGEAGDWRAVRVPDAAGAAGGR